MSDLIDMIDKKCFNIFKREITILSLCNNLYKFVFV